jgi:TPR repeat protein
MGMEVCHVPRRFFCAVFCAGAALLAQASPQDDYLRGQKAFQSGDVVAAMAALRPAAEAGHGQAQTLLGFILDRADFVDEAARWYRAAAEQGVAQAHVALADFCLSGRGVAKDEKQGLAHFSKAASLGDEAAAVALERAHRFGLHGLRPDAVEADRWRARADELKRQRSASAASAAGPVLR